eukprot:6210927-Pleurochrysis_carterae.AAC.2
METTSTPQLPLYRYSVAGTCMRAESLTCVQASVVCAAVNACDDGMCHVTVWQSKSAVSNYNQENVVKMPSL